MPAPVRTNVRAIELDAAKRVIAATALPSASPGPEALRVDLQALSVSLAVGTSDPRPRRQQAAAIKRHARELRQGLTGCHRLLAWHLWFVVDAVGRDPLLAALRELEIAVDSFEEPSEENLRKLVTQDLAAVYQKHFGRRAGRSRPALGGAVSGPYVRFVVAVAEVLGFSISPNTLNIYLGRMHTPRS